MPEATDPLALRIDPDRVDLPPTGILVRARNVEDDRWVNADIVQLSYASLMEWLHSRGGDNPWAEAVVAVLLGHDGA